MRVGAASAAWVSTFFTCIAFGVGFLMVATPIPHDTATALIILCFVLAAISAYGAYRAHYHQDAPQPTASRGGVLPILPTASVVQAYRDSKGQIHLGRDIDQDNSYAILATFRNEPTAERPSRPIRSLSASIAYRNLEPVGSAFWFNSAAPSVDLEVHAEQSIVLAYVVTWTPTSVANGRPATGHAALITDERAAAEGKVSCVTFATKLGAATRAPISETLRVTLVENGRVLGRSSYLLRLGASRPTVNITEWSPVT
jgi:hypothetical protein